MGGAGAAVPCDPSDHLGEGDSIGLVFSEEKAQFMANAAGRDGSSRLGVRGEGGTNCFFCIF